jgi:hypothetical protein
LDNQTWEVFSAVDNDGLPGKDARVNTTDLSDAQEPIADSGNHQSDRIHVSCQ